jgi:SIR2-like domain
MMINKIMKKSVACLLGAGYSYVARVPLAKDLLKPNYVLALSERSSRRFEAVLQHYGDWQRHHPTEYPEQYLGLLYEGLLGPNAPKWQWAVEYVGAVIASAGTPPASLNRNPRYSNRVNRPSESVVHKQFWNAILSNTDRLSVLTTNYDILIERALRHRLMHRPPSPGCFYGGLPRPQQLKGAAQPFSRWSPERLVQMNGSIPVFKLHGSLNWSLAGEQLVLYQDMRAAYRNGGNAAIVPPVPEKVVPGWLQAVWCEAEIALRNSDVWVVCGYSAPSYDSEVLRLLAAGSVGRPLVTLLLSPDSEALCSKWQNIAPEATILPLPGLPAGTKMLAEWLAAN